MKRKFTDSLKTAIVELLRNESQASKPSIDIALAFSMAATVIERLPIADWDKDDYLMVTNVVRKPEDRLFTQAQIDEILAMLDEEEGSE